MTFGRVGSEAFFQPLRLVQGRLCSDLQFSSLLSLLELLELEGCLSGRKNRIANSAGLLAPMGSNPIPSGRKMVK